MPNAVQAFDRACVHRVMAHRRTGLDELFVLGSHTGEKGVPWSLLLLMLRVFARDGQRLSIRRGLAITVGAWAIARALKRLDHRRRPCQNADATPLVACPESSSMPSDEAACAFAAAAYASGELPRLSALLYLGASFTAASRVYVGVHYPTDVAAGALLGAAIAWFAVRG
jgi:undecaprenyl-diphosphatase